MNGQNIQIIGQITGIVAMLLSALSFQMKTHKKIMIVQLFTAAAFAIHFFLIGGKTAAAINVASIIRNIVFYHKDKKIFSGKIWTVIFAVILGGFGLASWEGWLTLFMVVSAVFNTLSLSCTNPQNVRKIILISSPLALIYNLFTFSVGGIINEIMAMVSAVVGLIRYRNK